MLLGSHHDITQHQWTNFGVIDIRFIEGWCLHRYDEMHHSPIELA